MIFLRDSGDVSNSDRWLTLDPIPIVGAADYQLCYDITKNKVLFDSNALGL